MTEEKNENKCDTCDNWALGCELDGDFRRDCKKNNYYNYIPLKSK